MSNLFEYRERRLAQQQDFLKSLQENPRLWKEIQFEIKLRASYNEHGQSLLDAKVLINPVLDVNLPSIKVRRRAQIVKTYRNHLTVELVQSKGGNHKPIGAWKTQFGAEEVENWVKY